MTTLRSALDSLAANFANAVLAAIRGASLDELVAGGGGAPRRGPGRPRRSSTTKSAPSAARASLPASPKAKTKGGRLARRSPADIKEGLAKKALKSKGQKRATVYTAA